MHLLHSTGVGANDVHSKWDPKVVTWFGKTNRGVSALVMSLKYSVGYVSLSETRFANLRFANLVNVAGGWENALKGL